MAGLYQLHQAGEGDHMAFQPTQPASQEAEPILIYE